MIGMLSILIYLFIIHSKVEEQGYLYSIQKKMFLTYDEDIKNSLILLTNKTTPKQFKIVEVDSTQSGDLFIYLNEAKTNNLVLDKSGSTAELIGYPKHGGSNQVFTLKTVPNRMIKMFVDGKCMSTHVSSNIINEQKCGKFDSHKGQYFVWINENEKDMIARLLIEDGK